MFGSSKKGEKLARKGAARTKSTGPSYKHSRIHDVHAVINTKITEEPVERRREELRSANEALDFILTMVNRSSYTVPNVINLHGKTKAACLKQIDARLKQLKGMRKRVGSDERQPLAQLTEKLNKLRSAVSNHKEA